MSNSNYLFIEMVAMPLALSRETSTALGLAQGMVYLALGLLTPGIYRIGRCNTYCT
jgi:hypothetical protein